MGTVPQRVEGLVDSNRISVKLNIDVSFRNYHINGTNKDNNVVVNQKRNDNNLPKAFEN